jgi:hypothetical protein
MTKPYDPKDFYYRKAKAEGLRARSAFKIEEIAFDPNNARYLVTCLTEQDGFTAPEQVIEHLQTTQFMNDPIKHAEKLLLDRKIRHGGHEPLHAGEESALVQRLRDGAGEYEIIRKVAKHFAYLPRSDVFHYLSHYLWSGYPHCPLPRRI